MYNNYLSEISSQNIEQIAIELTTKCNGKCLFCFHHYDNFGIDMEREVFNRIMEIPFSKLKRINTTGLGESFLSPFIEELIDYCNSRDIILDIITNGTLLNNDEFVAKVVRSNLNIFLSINGATKQTYEYYTNITKWETLIEALECINRNVIAAGDEKKFYFQFYVVGLKKNVVEMQEYIKLAHKYGAKAVAFNALVGGHEFPKMKGESILDMPQTLAYNYYNSLELSEKLSVPVNFGPMLLDLVEKYKNSPMINPLKKEIEINEIKSTDISIEEKILVDENEIIESEIEDNASFEKAAVSLERNDTNIIEDSPIEIKNAAAKITGLPCDWPWKKIAFSVKGNVFPCFAFKGKIGNIKEYSLEDILNSSLHRNFRRNLYSWNPSEACQKCCFTYDGITGGNATIFDEYFQKFKKISLSIDSEEISYVDGFYYLEYHVNKLSHIWMNKKGIISLPNKENAKFLCINIYNNYYFKNSPLKDINPGQCFINGKLNEPFDSSNGILHFPIDHIKDDKLEITLEMDNAYKIEPYERYVSIAIRGFEYLF